MASLDWRSDSRSESIWRSVRIYHLPKRSLKLIFIWMATLTNWISNVTNLALGNTEGDRSFTFHATDVVGSEDTCLTTHYNWLITQKVWEKVPAVVVDNVLQLEHLKNRFDLLGKLRYYPSKPFRMLQVRDIMFKVLCIHVVLVDF